MPLKANKIEDGSVFLMGLSVLLISANNVKSLRTVQRRNSLAFISKAIKVLRSAARITVVSVEQMLGAFDTDNIQT